MVQFKVTQITRFSLILPVNSSGRLLGTDSSNPSLLQMVVKDGLRGTTKINRQMRLFPHTLTTA